MAVIEFHHVDKIYQLGQRHRNLREAISGSLTDLMRRRAYNPPRLLRALDNLSFKVDSGETLGIIGHNGAGKSTILKLLSRVAYPTRGTICTYGRIAALIELGAGFHPELSGRENVYLNGSILGLKRREIAARFEEIVDFAGLDRFIDTPIKRYSSGMYVRLAFAVAAHVQSDILLVDEVLAVGDTPFQQKCMTKMQELRDLGVTIVLVTHNLWTVETFCGRAILLNQGQIAAEGLPGEVIQMYRQHERTNQVAPSETAVAGQSDHPDTADSQDSNAAITQVELLDNDRQLCKAFDQWAYITVRVHYMARQTIQSPLLVVRISRVDGLVCCRVMNNREPNFAKRRLDGEGTFEVTAGPLPLMPDTYSVDAHIADSQQPVLYASSSKQTFQINGDLGDTGEAGVFWIDSEWQNPETHRQ